MNTNPTLATGSVRRRPGRNVGWAVPTKVRRGRPRRQPSGRNLHLYYELVCESRTRSVVALRFRLSPQRVSQLRDQIAAWIDEMLAHFVGATAGRAPAATATGRSSAPRMCLSDPATRVGATAGLPSSARFHLAIALRHTQLTTAYNQYLDQFGGSPGAAAFGHLLQAHDAGLLPADLASRLPSRDLLASALRMARELDDLARLIHRGPFHALLAAPPSGDVTSLAARKDNCPLTVQFLLTGRFDSPPPADVTHVEKNTYGDQPPAPQIPKSSG